MPTSGGPETLVASFNMRRTLTLGQLAAPGDNGTVAGALAGTPRSGTYLLSPLNAIGMIGPATLSGPETKRRPDQSPSHPRWR